MANSSEAVPVPTPGTESTSRRRGAAAVEGARRRRAVTRGRATVTGR